MKSMSEEKVFAQELSDDELGLINGGSNSIEGNAVSIEYDCARLDHRDIYEGGFPNCAATVESKSYCWSNDAYIIDAWYDDIWGAGIGAGNDGDENTIIITGGHISAHGYQAVGCGEDGDNGTLQLGDNIWAMSCGNIFPYADRYGYARANDIELITR